MRPPPSQRRPGEFGGVGAVVAGGDYQGLGVVRSLGRRGVPVCVIDDELSIARFSRYRTHALRVPDLRSGTSIAEAMQDAGSRLGLAGWVLFATRDEMVTAFSQHREELSRTFRVPTPAWDVVGTALDKRLTYELAEELNIPTPRTWRVRNGEELAGLDLTYPIALKPAIKEHFIYVAKVKALRADDPRQLERLFERVTSVIPPEEVLIQELIPGGGESQFSYCAFFKNDRPVAKMVVRRTRQRPVDFGRSSTYVETVELPDLDDPSERFLTEIGYYGLAELEYKFDRREGRYKLLDVNLRTWGYHSIGRRAGVDFPYLLFRDLVDGPVDPCEAAAPGVSWIRLTTDIPTALQEMFCGRLEVGPFVRSLRDLQVEAVFERDDLLPAFAELALLPYLYRTRGTSNWRAA